MLAASAQVPEGMPLTTATRRMEECAPGVGVDLLAPLQAPAEMKTEVVTMPDGPVGT